MLWAQVQNGMMGGGGGGGWVGDMSSDRYVVHCLAKIVGKGCVKRSVAIIIHTHIYMPTYMHTHGCIHSCRSPQPFM